MKKVKMVIYGEPGVGKSVFALGAPKPFFITTDGNYEWLEDFGANEKNHVQVFSWAEAKKWFTASFEDYDTIVVDLTEDLFKWCEYEYCKKNGYEHVSDIGFGKGYDITRNEFFIELSKLLGQDKNIILIMHGLTYTVKDRRGVEHTKYGPTDRIPTKVMDMIEGRVRYFLRAYLTSEENQDGQLIKKRFLSLIPKENEFGICRGIDENQVPHDILLDWNVFASAIGLSQTIQKKEEQKNEVKQMKVVDIKKEDVTTLSEAKIAEQSKKTEVKPVEVMITEAKIDSKPLELSKEEIKPAEQKQLTNAEKLASIKAKLAKLNANK